MRILVVEEVPGSAEPGRDGAVTATSGEAVIETVAGLAAAAERLVRERFDLVIVCIDPAKGEPGTAPSSLVRAAGPVPVLTVRGGGPEVARLRVELDDARNRMATIFDSITDGFLTMDREWRFTFANRMAEELLQRPAREFLGRVAWEAFPEAAGSTFQREYERAVREGMPVFFEEYFEPLDKWFQLRAFPSEEGIAVYFQDVTEQKKLLAQFLRAQRLESIGTLAGGVAHDLNNVLSPILMSIALLRDEVRGDEAQEILDTIEASAERGADMVRQVLSFSRGVEGARLRVHLGELIGDLTRVIRDTFPKNITLSTELGEGLWPVSGDPTQVHQVLMNLVLNARDAMPGGGRLQLAAENVEIDEAYAALVKRAEPGPWVRLTVTDSGAGMSPEVLARIFDPFFTTKEVGKGTGLGLPTVEAIVRGHEGFLNVYSEPGSGTTFRVYLPAATEEEGTAAPGGASTVRLERGQGELILVVDDEASVRAITGQTLEAFGYRVVTATDGADAVAVFGRLGDTIDLVLTDLTMPIMDGPSLIRALRRMRPGVKIVAASGLGANGGVLRAAESGVRHFIPKPYTADTLLDVLHRVLRGEAAAGPE